MENNSRIKVNPATREIEIEGSEEFIKIYFDKLQAMMLSDSKAAVVEPRAQKRSVKNGTDGQRRVSNIDKVIGLVHESETGMSTAELKERTGLDERQIWSIVNRASKGGRIRKMKRGLYGKAT